MLDYEAERVRSVIAALGSVREHVSRGGYDQRYWTSDFNRWLDTLEGEPLQSVRPLRLRGWRIGRDALIAHLDATIAFLGHELAAFEDDGGGDFEEVPEEDEEGEDGGDLARGWTPRIVKE